MATILTVEPVLSPYLRWRCLLRVAASLAILLPLTAVPEAQAQVQPLPRCEVYRITGYVRGHFNPWTYDGTSVWTREKIAAASWNLPINSRVRVQGLGDFRIADRGGRLGPRHIDVLVDSVQQARAITGWRTTCVVEIGKGRTPAPKPAPPKSVTSIGVPRPTTQTPSNSRTAGP